MSESPGYPLAHRLLSAGALGVTCAKLGEAEVMATAGIREILIANQIVGPRKIARLMDILTDADVIVALDSLENVQELDRAASDASRPRRDAHRPRVRTDRVGHCHQPSDAVAHHLRCGQEDHAQRCRDSATASRLRWQRLAAKRSTSRIRRYSPFGLLAARSARLSCILRGTEGVIQYSVARGLDAPPLILESRAPRWRSASRRSFQLTPTPSPGYGGLAGLDIFRQFLAAGPGDPTPADAVDALRVLEILDAAYASAASGCAVEVERSAPNLVR